MSLLHNSFVILICAISMLHAFTTAKEYFDTGAQTYVLKNDAKKAKSILQEGINAFPNDEQLKKLIGKIKEEENKQDQNKNDQNQNKQDQMDQQQQQDKKEDQNKQDQNKDQQKKDEQKQDQQNQQDQKDQKEQQQKQMQQSEMKEQQDLKKEEAKRIIEMYADDADTLNKPMTKQKAGIRQPQQDW